MLAEGIGKENLCIRKAAGELSRGRLSNMSIWSLDLEIRVLNFFDNFFISRTHGFSPTLTIFRGLDCNMCLLVVIQRN